MHETMNPAGISLGVSGSIKPTKSSLRIRTKQSTQQEFISGYTQGFSIKNEDWIETLDKLGIQSGHKELNLMTTQMNLCLIKSTQQDFYRKHYGNYSTNCTEHSNTQGKQGKIDFRAMQNSTPTAIWEWKRLQKCKISNEWSKCVDSVLVGSINK